VLNYKLLCWKIITDVWMNVLAPSSGWEISHPSEMLVMIYIPHTLHGIASEERVMFIVTLPEEPKVALKRFQLRDFVNHLNSLHILLCIKFYATFSFEYSLIQTALLNNQLSLNFC
jgi:hypothetical protein